MSLLACAVDCVRKKERTVRKASKTFGVSYGTLWNRVSEKHTGRRGRPLQFTPEEEQQLANVAACCDRVGLHCPNVFSSLSSRELQPPQVL